MTKTRSGNEIRQEFIRFFEDNGHKFVPSSSLVPGGDQTLLFSNAGMVQFKDVFLGTDKRDYKRAVNAQKCMRVAGKHNDLEDVGRDDLHHTFFEMLGNWSFGDYYKKEAIAWAWELLTDVWGLEKEKIWVTCFKDENGEIETDDEAANNWHNQPGIDPSHILFFGRKDNFWEMADTGPCGPCSEIHYDKGESFCDRKNDPDHRCEVNGDCHRFLELWNLVFIQYNRTSPTDLQPLPAKHVDTGMGFDRIVSVLQNVDSNYRTDIMMPLINVVMELINASETDRDNDFTPFRVIADHARAATFLIADGVIPGNVGRNYVCRMIIRRASRFGSKLGLSEPFIGKVAKKVIEIYGKAYSELIKNQKMIIEYITREEERFQNTVETGLTRLDEMIVEMSEKKIKTLVGTLAFELYATHGLPLEITRDVLREKGLDVDQKGFYDSMEEHKINSGAGKEFGQLGGDDAEFYSNLAKYLHEKKWLPKSGVDHNPYEYLSTQTKIAAIIQNEISVNEIDDGSMGEMIVRQTGFYIESGGQVSDTGNITSLDGESIFRVQTVRKPAPGIIVHVGKVVKGSFHPGDSVIVDIDQERRLDIMRNHTATHLLQAVLRKKLGDHIRQAGSLVAPDRLRFDFTHPNALTKSELQSVEDGVNYLILDNYSLQIANKRLSQALDEGAMALFGEKYGEEVRTISISGDTTVSYELCGGTHVNQTGDIGTFIITSEGSAAAGIRRIEAVTGRKAYAFISKTQKLIDQVRNLLECSFEEVLSVLQKTLDKNEELLKEIQKNSFLSANVEYEKAKKSTIEIKGNQILILSLRDSTIVTMRSIADQFRKDFHTGIAIITNIDRSNMIQLIVSVSDDLAGKKYHAGEIAKRIAGQIGGSGGGRPQLAQGGGNQPEKLKEITKNISVFL